VWRTLTYAFVTKTLWNGYRMPSEHGQATNPATMTAAERKRRQRNLFPHLADAEQREQELAAARRRKEREERRTVSRQALRVEVEGLLAEIAELPEC
jgi:hypothetical protein